MMDFKQISVRMANVKRKHKIAAVAVLLILGLMLVLNTVLARKPTLSTATAAVTKKSVKTTKPAAKKTKITDSNQVSDSNLITDKPKKSARGNKPAGKKVKIADDSNLAASTAKKSAKTSKSISKKTKSADGNQVLDSNWIELAEGVAPSVLAGANDNISTKNSKSAAEKITDSNEALDVNEIIGDINKPADSNIVKDNNMPITTVLPQPKPESAELSANLGHVQSGIQSLVFVRNMPIIDALQLLAVRYGKNIIPMSSLNGTLNFNRLSNVSFDEAMSAILGNNYRYQQQGNLVKVYSLKEYQNSEMVCRVFALYYISAAEAKKMITPVISSDGKIEVTTAAETGVPVDETVSSPKGAGNSVAINDMVVVYDYPDRIARAEQIIAAIDVRPKQVLIEATILTATLTNGMELGIDWQSLERSAVTALTGITEGVNGYIGVTGSSSAHVNTSSLSGGMTIGVTQGNIATFIRAVEEITDVTILANPKILAANKQLGQVYIGTKVAYQSQTTQSGGNDSTTSKVEFLDTGTKLSFRPYIGNDGYIRMDIHPKDSSAGASKLTATLPDETSAEIVTNIIVKDGETIVIGGLFRDKVNTIKKQVPVLGNIPIVGLAFGSHADEARREEVIVLLTPHIISEPNQTEGAERANDVARKKMGAEDELHPTNRMKMATEHYEKAAVYYIGGRNIDALKELKNAIELYPNYLNAIALEEKIYNETDPKKKPVRKIVDKAEKPQSDKWRRK